MFCLDFLFLHVFLVPSIFSIPSNSLWHLLGFMSASFFCVFSLIVAAKASVIRLRAVFR